MKGCEMTQFATHPWQPVYKVDLPQGGSLAYKLREPLQWHDAPEYYLAQVNWRTAKGKIYSFDAGGVYTRRPDIEFYLRDDGQAVWTTVVLYTGRPPDVDFGLDLVARKLVSPVPEWWTVGGGRWLKKHLVSKE